MRNIRPGLKKGLWMGLINAAFETYITHGKSPWTLQNKGDDKQLKPAKESDKITYPKPDGKITFDRLSSLYLSNLYYSENQPNFLHLKDPQKVISVNQAIFDFPEGRYCPAFVYELLETSQGLHLQINGKNCLQCKACDIKDPTQNITWTPPEGGSGPHYVNM